jgi:hypothetical protein
MFPQKLGYLLSLTVQNKNHLKVIDETGLYKAVLRVLNENSYKFKMDKKTLVFQNRFFVFVSSLTLFLSDVAT